MIPREVLQQIFESAVRAPSGENSQPWRFVVKGEKLLLYNLPERDRSLYNYDQLGSLVAHGALIENMVIAASAFGYEVSIALFPSSSDPDCTASITFQKSKNIDKDELYEFIAQRVSNRTSYEPVPLRQEDKVILLKNSGRMGSEGRVVFVDDAGKKKRLAEAVSYGDRLLFENTKVHDFLFGHIHWTLQDASISRSGFYVKELALTPPQEAVFKLLRKNFVLQFFKKIGFPKIAAKGNSKLYAGSSAFGAIITKRNTKEDFINGGRLMERVWLDATRLEYSIQPLTAIAFFMQRILHDAAQDFPEDQVRGIKDSYAIIQKELEIGSDTVVMFFRIGKGGKAPHRSFRLEPEIIYA